MKGKTSLLAVTLALLIAAPTPAAINNVATPGDGIPDIYINLSDGTASIDPDGAGTLNGIGVKSAGAHLTGAATLPSTFFLTNTTTEASATFISVDAPWDLGTLIAPSGLALDSGLPATNLAADLTFTYNIVGKPGVFTNGGTNILGGDPPPPPPYPTTLTSTTISLDPTATYLRTAPEDHAPEPTPIELASLVTNIDVKPLHKLRMETVGEFAFSAAKTSFGIGLLGVFSGDDYITDDRSVLERVPAAIDAGKDFISPVSGRDGGATDIPEDFLIRTPVDVVIPEGATHLITSTLDGFFTDNSDDDNDLGVKITILPNGDYDFDGDRDITDLEYLQLAIRDDGPADYYSVDDAAVLDNRDFNLHRDQLAGLLPGDVDGDFDIDGDDIFQILEAGKFATESSDALWSDGDFDNDGDVDGNDILMILATGQYDRGTYAARALSPTAVPEPATLATLALLAAGLTPIRRRRPA